MVLGMFNKKSVKNLGSFERKLSQGFLNAISVFAYGFLG